MSKLKSLPQAEVFLSDLCNRLTEHEGHSLTVYYPNDEFVRLVCLTCSEQKGEEDADEIVFDQGEISEEEDSSYDESESGHPDNPRSIF